MTTRLTLSNVTRLIAIAACTVLSASCGSELLRTGRSPVMLILEQLSAATGNNPTQFANPLLSDVQVMVETTVGGQTVDVPTIFNDLGRATIRAELKAQGTTLNPTAASPLNAVTITRYRVTYRRADGRNAPGVDVPFGFDGGTAVTIQPGGTGDVVFDLVRHAAKSEPPLRNLVNGGGLRFLSTIADVTFFGRDQNGNEVVITGSIDVVFGDFGDEE
jgi:hypothetical protein